MRGSIAAALMLAATSAAAGDPATTDGVVAPAPAPKARDGWQPGMYLEPSVLYTPGTYSSVPAYVAPYLPHDRGFATRFALGVIVRDHVGDETPWRVRGGAVMSLTSLQPSGYHRQSLASFGIESEVDRPVARDLRAGARLGIERGGDAVYLASIGARLHYRELAWVGVDAFYLSRAHDGSPSCNDIGVPDCSAPATGVMAGLGLEGKPGAAVGTASLVIGAVIAVIAVASFHVPG